MSFDELTPEVRQAIEVLVSYPPTADPWVAPIHAVDQVLGYTSNQSRALVQLLLETGYLELETNVLDVSDPAGTSTKGVCSWVRGDR